MLLQLNHYFPAQVAQYFALVGHSFRWQRLLTCNYNVGQLRTYSAPSSSSQLVVYLNSFEEWFLWFFMTIQQVIMGSLVQKSLLEAFFIRWAEQQGQPHWIFQASIFTTRTLRAS
jgi:hypothetical protein